MKFNLHWIINNLYNKNAELYVSTNGPSVPFRVKEGNLERTQAWSKQEAQWLIKEGVMAIGDDYDL